MTQKNLRNILVVTIIFWVTFLIAIACYAALYNIDGTTYYVNGLPTNLKPAERALLKTTTITKTDAAIEAGKYVPVSTSQAKTKIKELLTPPAPPVSPPATDTGWTKCADEWATCQFQGLTKNVRFGDGTNWSDVVSGAVNYYSCDSRYFKNVPAVHNQCQMTVGASTTPTPPVEPPVTVPPVTTPPVTVPPTSDMSLMPIPDLTTVMKPVAGYSKLYVYPTSEQPQAGGDGAGQSAFRIDCPSSFEAQIDPIVAFGKDKSMHLHSFFGNVGITKDSKPSDMSKYNSTCNGGTLNRSGYWVPVIIDTSTGQIIHATKNGVYYKSDAWTEVVAPPKGLVMIAGNQNATDSSKNDVFANNSRFTCNEDYNTHADHIPNCTKGSTMEYLLAFRSCWNGKDLDSPDHQSHMAYPLPNSNKCPAGYPVHIPIISYNIHYDVTTNNGTKYWRLASDAYSWDKSAGYSLHGDYFEGWTRKGDSTESDKTGANIEDIVTNCLRNHYDAHSHLLCNGYYFDNPAFHPNQ